VSSQRRALLAARETGPRLAAGLATAAASIAAVTLAIFALKDVAPVVSLGVVYLLAVLLVASLFGLWLGLVTAVGSALAFNFFHLPPTGRFTIHEAENWVALVIFLVVAVVASTLAQRARTRAEDAEARRREANLALELARLLLRGDDLDTSLPAAAQRLAAALGVSSAAIVLRPDDGDERRLAFPLREGTRRLGTLLLPRDASETTLRRVQERVVPPLEALLAAALERADLLNDVVETRSLRRSDVVKTALLRAVSHDLRSPLTAILTAVEPLAAQQSDPDLRQLALDARDEAQRLSRLIDQLLDLSRLEGHAADPRPDWCSLEEIVETAIEDLDAGDGAFRVQLDKDLPLIRADAVQLERALANVLENARRHSDGHPVQVRGAGLHNRVMLRIVDRGPGIPAAQLERVFQPFYRSGTEETGHRGSGLGLAIARGFVEANGGRIWVESLPGQATTFVIELPLEVPTPAQDAAGAAA
jgi:two-component system, OmpR family, sensor histidine kinase KdpD